MRALRGSLRRVRASNVSVFVHGETGTGKELVARTLHVESKRSRGPFVAVNCAAIPESLQEAELFGHERGAFTGATQAHHGRFEQADGGTLFLDEIGDMIPAMQAKLLRALQERSVRRVGGSVDVRVDVRIVCATHKDLEAEVARGRFREDLYFRLMVFPVEVPPLRARLNDVPLLVEHFLHALRHDVEGKVPSVSSAALAALSRYRWPGNVRQLQNVVHRAMLWCDGGEIDVCHLPDAIIAEADPAPAETPHEGGALPVLDLRELELLAITLALRRTGDHIARAAKLLGIGRSTLYRRLIELGLTPRDEDEAA